MDTLLLKKRFDNTKKVMASQVHAISLCTQIFNWPWDMLLRWYEKCYDSKISEDTEDWFVRHEFLFYRFEDSKSSTGTRVSVLFHYRFGRGYEHEPDLYEGEVYVGEILVATLKTTFKSRMGEAPDVLVVDAEAVKKETCKSA